MSFRYSKRLEADLALLTVSLIWGIAFVAQRMAAVQAGVFLFNGLRFLIGALVLLPFAWMRSTRFQRANLPGVGMAVFAALFGWLWLNEALTAWQLLGCGLMLSGVLLAQIHTGDTDRTALE